jgi:hypothetical protein
VSSPDLCLCVGSCTHLLSDVKAVVLRHCVQGQFMLLKPNLENHKDLIVPIFIVNIYHIFKNINLHRNNTDKSIVVA